MFGRYTESRIFVSAIKRNTKLIIMKIQVTNTIDNSTETFNNLADAKEHVATELRWFNSNGDSYDESDFLIEERN